MHSLKSGENLNICKRCYVGCSTSNPPARAKSCVKLKIPHAGGEVVPPFDVMYSQLQEWQRRFQTCHVPRHCFDAETLGMWVHSIRRQCRNGKLEEWKKDRLSRLGFEWSISNEDAKWHAHVHHLRQFRLLNGESEDPFYDGHHNAWKELQGWIDMQGLLLSAGKLPQNKRQILECIGITLRVPEEAIYRNIKLQGLNAHERRLARKRWRREDAEKASKIEHAEKQLRELQHRRRWVRDMISKTGSPPDPLGANPSKDNWDSLPVDYDESNLSFNYFNQNIIDQGQYIVPVETSSRSRGKATLNAENQQAQDLLLHW
jgi:hypothetical protein